jgi:hypothetical protein
MIFSDRAETEKPVLVDNLEADNKTFPVKCAVLADDMPALSAVYAPAYKAFRLPIEEANILEINFLPASDGLPIMRVRYEKQRKNAAGNDELKPSYFLSAAERFFRWLRKNFETVNLN